MRFAALIVGLLWAPAVLGQDSWIDLFNGKDLKGWKRVPVAPDEKVKERNPWSVDEANKLLLCDGAGIKEMLLHERPVSDGVFHVEWRFRPTKDKVGYNGGIYVRTAADGKVWLQSQVAMLEKPPLVGDLFGDMLVTGRLKRVEIPGTGHKHVKPVGEWNTTLVTCRGKLIEVQLNGAVVTKWDNCEVPVGHVGLQAEFYFLEFKNLKFRTIGNE